MSTPRTPRARDWWLPLLVLAVLVYVPLLLTEAGAVVADTKSYLYLDPGRLLSRAVSMWDPHVGLGTVPHQQIGYLWPAGPWYWAFEQLGAPDWVAQRLWLGTIMVGAGGGVLFLGRTWRWRPTAATAAAFAYALSPFVLTLAARISVILLPFAGLPWLLALTVRALHTRGWRYPALFGLVVATVGSVNATSILLVGLVPVLWIAYSTFGSHDVTRSRAATTTAKIGAVTIAVNLWWIGGLSVQATDGIEVLRYTETAEVVANASVAPEVLRGLGYWFFYGDDRLGPWIEPSVDYTQRLWLIALTYGIAVLGLLSLGVVRWRHRSFLVGILLVGTVVAVGAHPWGSPPPVAALIKAFLLTDLGLAMRSLPRAVPLVALALALGIGSLVGALAEQVSRRGLAGAAVVAALAYAALPPLWMREMVPANLQRPEEIPSYWYDVAGHLEGRGDDTRVLEIPGADFASYRWGNTVDPILPGIMDRPYVARELIPYGTAPSADLLNAVDLELQEQTTAGRGLAAVARLMGVGDVLLRNDLQYERYNTPRPRSLLALASAAPGLGEPTRFGEGVPNVAVADAPMIDEQHLARDGALPESPAVVVFPVEDPQPIVRTHADEQMVILSGDGTGIVHAAEAGLLHGDELIRYSADLTDDPDFVRTQLRDRRGLVVTDTNRKRGERWTTVRHTQGYTETQDGGLLRDDRTDNRLPVFEDRPGTQTVAEHRGLGVQATGYGNPITFTPEERPANAADGDPTTAWRVAAFDDAVGHQLVLTAPEPVTTDRITLLQPQTGEINRWITEVELSFDGDDAMTVELDDSSRTAPGQTIDIGERSFRELTVEIRADTAGRRPGWDGLTSVGFAEVDVAGLRLDEVIRMPSDLLEAGGFRTRSYPLALVQTRVRSIPTEVTRTDEEFAMARAVDLPATRTYALDGEVRLSARADAPVLDALLGRGGPAAGMPTVTASTRLPGGLAHLPSNVLDGDPSTWWTTTFAAPPGQRLRIEAPAPTTATEVRFVVVDDPQHSVPRAVTVVADGAEVLTAPLDLQPAGDGLAAATVALPGPVTASSFELAFPDVAPRTTIDWYSQNPIVLPLAVADLDLGGLTVPARPDAIDTGCRDDLLTIDGEPVAVRIQGRVDHALAGGALPLVPCGDAVTIPGGDRLFRTAEGRDTGLDLDRLVWRSAAGGGPGEPGSPIVADGPDAPTVSVLSQDDATVDVRVTGAEPGRPFWLVLGQSHSPGWQLDADDAESEGTELVDGFANGFLVTPEASSFEATIRFVPQNRVEVGLLVSALAAIGALVLVLLPARELRPLPIPLQEPVRRLRALTWEGALPDRRDARILGVVAGIAGALLITPPIGIAIGLAAGFAARRETWRPVFTVLPAALLAAVAGYVLVTQFRNEIPPGLHWPNQTGRLHPLGLTAVVLLAVDVAISELWWRRSDYR
ncbi:MAG TPA: alpha-(1-_3)-arabinofuranosyltransferase family protein [Acidimicrobiales bacterium]|nr:alpha-(1->3)-arabinofuranosyltransferase family protein [Acidimicrobiales bacterium]